MVEKKKLYSYEIEIEGNTRNLIINCVGSLYYPSIEDNEFYMSMVIGYLIETGFVNNITLAGERNYIYTEEQAQMLYEIAQAYIHLIRQEKIISIAKLGPTDSEKKFLPERINTMRSIVLELLRSDPVSAYVKAIRTLREQKVKMEALPLKQRFIFKTYVNALETVITLLEKTRLIKKAKPFIAGHKIGDRAIYRELFEPIIKPNFMLTRLMAEAPLKGEEVDSYNIGKFEKSTVVIYKLPNTVRLKYHISPPEFNLTEEENTLLTDAQKVLSRYKPKGAEFVDPSRMRMVFYNIAKDLLDELAVSKGLHMKYNEIEELSRILVRLTVGFGLIEVLLEDPYIEDIYINAPIGQTPIFLKHAKYGECETNIIPNIREAEAWASRFRMISQRPLDEANPVLDTELFLPAARTRVAIIQRPLSPQGYSFVYRKHKPTPFTFPMYINYKFLSPLAAGLLWFLTDGARTMMIAGTRGTGKSSLLGCIIGNIMRKYRIITVEDTLELPVEYYRKLGFNIIPMKVRSAILGEKSELSAAEGVRTSLRLGDSALIVGEVRSKEALALYEAMRVGALANVVAGTIHGDSPYGVFDRVVNDLGVPRTSFKATDIIMVANKIRGAGQLTENRRLTTIAEVRKHWEEDPLKEQGFVHLMEYDSKKDTIVPTSALLDGDSEVVKSIAGKVRDWVGNWDRVWDNIVLRGKIAKIMADYAKKPGNSWIQEADFVVVGNDNFHKIFGELKEESGYPDSKDVLFQFENWLKTQIRMRKKR